MNKEKNYITPEGYRNLIDENEFLQKEERPAVVKVVSWAASLGDRSENADYQYGKKRLREIDRRLRFLSRRLDAAIVVDPTESSGDAIKFGATVLIEDEEGQQKEYKIVGVDEIDSKKGRISWKSPIGMGLLGKSVGDDATITSPNGLIEFEILEVRFERIEIPKFEKKLNVEVPKSEDHG